jgi:hypothetical protein
MAKFDSVDQGVKDLPIDSVSLNGNTMSFVAAKFGMSDEATLNDKGVRRRNGNVEIVIRRAAS